MYIIKITSVFLLLSSLVFAETQDSVIRVGACETPGSANGVQTLGFYSYIADRGGLTSVEVTVPSLPSVSYYLNEPRCEALGVYIKDTFAYLNSAGGPSFTLVNISNPNLLARISWVEVPGWGGSEPNGIYAEDTLVYFADGSAGFLIIDISDLLDPTILCTLDTPGRVIDLYIRDTLAYLADLDSLLIVNVKDPKNPFIIGHIGIPGRGAYDVWVSGDYVFVTEEDIWFGQGKINMINVSNPSSPFLVDQISVKGTPYGLFVVNNRIYVAADDWWEPPRPKGEGRADIEGGIRVLHWEAPDTMILLDNTDTPGRCRDIFVVDSFIYIAAWDSFMIYKYTNTGITENDNETVLLQSLIASPNPFSYQTKINFAIPTKSFASIEIYDAQGRRVKDLAGGYFVPGHYEVFWDGRDNNGLEVASGVYYVKLITKSGVIRNEKKHKIIYLK
jgi:hypothetical protein